MFDLAAGSADDQSASAPAIWTARTRALIRRNPIDHWVITVGKRGTVELTTGNTCVSPGVGVPYVISLADEMETTKSDYSRLQFYLGRDGFHEIDSCSRLRGRRLLIRRGAACWPTT